jgi:hypothetical protein
LLGADEAEITAVAALVDAPYSFVVVDLYKEGSPFVPEDLYQYGEEDNGIQVFVGGERLPFYIHFESMQRD